MTPLLVTIPHTGTDVPPQILARWTDAAKALPDTDWHLAPLYDFVPRIGAGLLVARYSRYVIDLNRPADGHALYPGRDETARVPTSTFEQADIYLPEQLPSADEIAERTERYWRPWHDEVRRQLALRKARFGFAVLFDAHSIRSEVPRFFSGRLPGLMLGTADGHSCDPQMAQAALDVFEASPFSWALNAPFKGGHITRSFGAPVDGVHALQLEMSQRLYMDEDPPFQYNPSKADVLKPWLERALQAILATLPALKSASAPGQVGAAPGSAGRVARIACRARSSHGFRTSAFDGLY
ncbi:MAG: N-formylglutamate deformylase [Myxococcota bacterium]